MKSIYYCFYAFAVVLLFLSCNHTLRDVDGNTYQQVRIGDQIWMAENLRVAHFRNGDEIPYAKTSEEWIELGSKGKPAWCFPGDNSKNEEKEGRLYNWYALNDSRGIAPDGWHVASDEEWNSMINYLGGAIRAAMILRINNSFQGEDQKSSFNGLPSGCRNQNGAYYGSGSYGYWWSSTADDSTSAWLGVLNYPKCDINFMPFKKIYGASVRCIKN